MEDRHKQVLPDGTVRRFKPDAEGVFRLVAHKRPGPVDDKAHLGKTEAELNAAEGRGGVAR